MKRLSILLFVVALMSFAVAGIKFSDFPIGAVGGNTQLVGVNNISGNYFNNRFNVNDLAAYFRDSVFRTITVYNGSNTATISQDSVFGGVFINGAVNSYGFNALNSAHAQISFGDTLGHMGISTALGDTALTFNVPQDGTAPFIWCTTEHGFTRIYFDQSTQRDTFHYPNKATGSYTIATTSDLVNNVVDTANVTSTGSPTLTTYIIPFNGSYMVDGYLFSGPFSVEKAVFAVTFSPFGAPKVRFRLDSITTNSTYKSVTPFKVFGTAGDTIKVEIMHTGGSSAGVYGEAITKQYQQ